MFLKYCKLVVYDWLRNQDLNLRPSGYEFVKTKTLKLETNAIYTILHRYVRFFIKPKHLKKYLHSTFFCQAVKGLTKNNCTNNCTETYLKSLACLLSGWNYIYKNLNINLGKIIYIKIFTTSRLFSRLFFISRYKQKTINTKHYIFFPDFPTLKVTYSFFLFFLFFLFFFNNNRKNKS